MTHRVLHENYRQVPEYIQVDFFFRMGAGSSSANKSKETPLEDSVAASNAPTTATTTTTTTASTGLSRITSAKASQYNGKKGRRPSFGSSSREIDTVEGVAPPKVTMKPAIRCGAGIASSKRHSQSFRITSFDASGAAKSTGISESSFGKESTDRTVSSKKRVGGMYAKAVEKPQHRNIFFGVVDGVGDKAEQAASFVRLFMRSKLSCSIDKGPIEPKDASVLLERVLKELANAMSTTGGSGTDTTECGAVCTVVYYADRTFVVGSIGDAKAFILTEPTEAGGDRQLVELTADHSWENTVERSRAESCGACIKRFEVDNVGSVGHTAVWESEHATKPGLTTSRVLGYTSAVQSCGVSPDPEVKVYDLDGFAEQHRCGTPQMVILASAGMWKMLPHGDVVRITHRCNDRYDRCSPSIVLLESNALQ